MLQGVLFDMDGLMFDTERIGRDGWHKAAEILHIDLPEEIIAARDLLAQNGQQADCVKLTQIYPLPDGLCDALTPYDMILFAEDSVRTGSIGEQLGFALQQCGWQGRYLLHAVDNTHLLHANVPELRKDQQLDAAALCTDILNHLKEKQA